MTRRRCYRGLIALWLCSVQAVVTAQAAPSSIALGNGSLSVGLDSAGNWLSCRWPSPGAPEHHASEDFAQPGTELGTWGVLLDGAWHWPGKVDSEWRAIPMDARFPGLWQSVLLSPDGATKILLQAVVHPIRDIALFRVTLPEAKQPVQLIWRGEFRPVARTVTGLAGLAEHLAPPQRGMPWSIPTHGEESNGLRWHAPYADSEVSPPTEGVYIGVCASSTNGDLDRDVPAPSDAVPGATFLQIQTHAVEGGQAADIYLGCARTEEHLRTNLGDAMALGFEQISAESTAYWLAWDAALPVEAQRVPGALRSLVLATDRSSGAIIDSTIGDPARGVVSARTTAWAAWAYDCAGDPRAATRALQFLARTVVRQARPGIPAGLLPARLYTDGRPATPYAVCDMEGLCWFLGACARHATQLEEQARISFLESVSDAASEGADLLADWTLGPNGPPLPSLQPALGIDGESMQTLLLMLSGLQAATRIRALEGTSHNPDWSYRFDALLARALLARQEGNGPIPMDPLAAYWLRTGLLSAGVPRLAGLEALLILVDGETVRLAAAPCPAMANGETDLGDTLAAAVLFVCAGGTE